MSRVVSQAALSSSLVEKGVFTKQEFLGMVKGVDQEMKRKRKGNYYHTPFKEIKGMPNQPTAAKDVEGRG